LAKLSNKQQRQNGYCCGIAEVSVRLIKNIEKSSDVLSILING
jgi:hypothetical protein